MPHAIPTWKRRAAGALDALALFLLALAPYIVVSGGIDKFYRHIHFSATSVPKTLLYALVVLIARHLIVRRPSFAGTVTGLWRRWRGRARQYPRHLTLAAIGLLIAGLAIDMGDGVASVHMRTVIGFALMTLLALRLDPFDPSVAPRQTGTPAWAPALDGPSWREWVWATAVFTAATAIMFRAQLMAFTSVPDPGDPLFSIWRMAWIAHQLPIDPRHLFDANIFYPEVRTLAYSDSMIVPGLMAAPLIWLGTPVVVAYNAMFLVTFVLGGLAMFALARALTRDTGAALVAGLVFAFDPFKLAHYSHYELQFTFWMPLALLALLRALTSGRRRDGVMTGVYISLQALSSMYYAAFFCVSILGLAIGWLWVAGWPSPRKLWPLAAGGVIVVVTAALLTMPYRANRATVGERKLSEIAYYSAHGRNYLTGHPRSAVYGGMSENDVSERELFTGASPVVLAATAAIGPVAPVGLPLLAGLVASIDASLGVNGTVYRWLNVGPFRGFRVPARFRAVVGVYLAALAGLGVAGISRRLKSIPIRRTALVAMSVVVLFDLRPHLQLEPVWLTAPDIYARIPEPQAVVADMPVPWGDVPWWRDFTYMYFSTFHWHPLVNGQSGFNPERYESTAAVASRFPADTTLDMFKTLGTEYFVLHQKFYGDRYQSIVQAADSQSRLQFVAVSQWEGTEVRLYRLVR